LKLSKVQLTLTCVLALSDTFQITIPSIRINAAFS